MVSFLSWKEWMGESLDRVRSCFALDSRLWVCSHNARDALRQRVHRHLNLISINSRMLSLKTYHYCQVHMQPGFVFLYWEGGYGKLWPRFQQVL